MPKESDIWAIRRALERAFAPDTAVPGTPGDGPPSAGHCAAAAAVIRSMFGGDLLSTLVDGESHWFNRLSVDGVMRDVDVTGDQFGRAPVQIDVVDGIFADARVRPADDLNPETLERAVRLASRAGFFDAAAALRRAARSR